jgi:transcriptional regulator with XRE-family HTH domain
VSSAEENWGKRLRKARLEADLSQKQLGIQAGLDPFVASTRINRYELGVHRPDLLTAQNLARVLGVSVAYFYAEDDDVADVVSRYSKAPERVKRLVRQLLADL